MGRMVCEKHGQQAMTFFSPRAHQAFVASDEAVLDTMLPVGMDWEGGIKHTYWVHPEDAHQTTAPLSAGLSLDDMDRYPDFFSSLVPACSVCVEEWKNRKERR